MLPMIIMYFDILTSAEQKTEESLDSRDEYLKYFGLMLWSPPNIDKFPTYELVYTYKFIVTYTVSCCCCCCCFCCCFCCCCCCCCFCCCCCCCCCNAAHYVFFILMYNISTHIKILTSRTEALLRSSHRQSKQRMNVPLKKKL